MTLFASQQATLRSLLKNGSGSTLFGHLGINKLGQMRDFELLYQSFTRAVPVLPPKQFVENVAALQTGEAGLNAPGPLAALAPPGLLTRGRPLAATLWRGTPVPLDATFARDFLRAEKNLRSTLQAQGLVGGAWSGGAVYYLTEGVPSKRDVGLAQTHPLTVVESARSWFSRRGSLPRQGSLPEGGASRLHTFNSHLDQLKQHGAQVDVLVAHPRTLLDFGLYISQQAGRFVGLKELCPHLRVLAYNGPDPGVQRTELAYALAGLENLKWVGWHWLPVGVHLQQTDANLRGRYDLLAPSGVFYEFIPQEDILPTGLLVRNHRRFHAGQLETGREYHMVVSSTAGLLGVATGLVVKVLQPEPIKVAIKGHVVRLNGLGESLREDGLTESIANINMALAGHGVFIRDALLGHVLAQRQPVWALELSRPLSEVNDLVLESIAKRLSAELELRSEGYRLGIRQQGVQLPQVHMVPMGTFAAAQVGVPEFTHFDHSPDAAEVKKRVAAAWHSKCVQVV